MVCENAGMTRDGGIRRFFSLVLNIFFRRIKVVGAERVPPEGALVLAGNHENGLLDPLLLFCVSGRSARFLAKATLFRNPLVAPWLRLIKALPVYRRKDEGSDMSRNEATFQACEHLLVNGEALALFPEGISHDLSRLQPLKTGAARIVGRARLRGARPVLLPVGLDYSAKSTFRSEVTVTFGLPVPYEDLPWGAGTDPEAVEALTERLRTALESLTVNAERWEDLRFVDAVRGMALELAGLSGDDLDRVEVTRRLLEEFYRARFEHPTELHALLVKAKAYVRMLELLRLRDGDVAGETKFGPVLIHTWKRLAVVLAGYPPALYGWLFNFLPYFLTGRLALAAGGERDVVATYKLYAGLLLFPLFYLGQGAMIWRAAGPWWAALTVALGAPCGLWAMRYYAIRSDFVHLVSATVTLGLRRDASDRLKEMRAEVVEALKPLVEMYG
jgi:1-acyl-sn-glycerol-3-phosphate acyltransferase